MQISWQGVALMGITTAAAVIAFEAIFAPPVVPLLGAIVVGYAAIWVEARL